MDPSLAREGHEAFPELPPWASKPELKWATVLGQRRDLCEGAENQFILRQCTPEHHCGVREESQSGQRDLVAAAAAACQ